MNPDINTILEPNESVGWQGSVNKKVLTISFLFFLAVVLAIGGFFLSQDTIHYTSNGESKEIGGFMIGAVIIGVGLLLSGFSFLSTQAEAYAITAKRVIIKSGLISTDFKSVYFDQIQNIIVDVGLIGKIFGVGSIKIDTGKTKTYSTGGMGRKNGFRTGGIKTKVMYDMLKYTKPPLKSQIFDS